MSEKFRKYQREYRKMYYHRLKAEGLCTKCKKLNLTDKVLCEVCTREYNIMNRERMARVREKKSSVIDDDKGEYKMTEEERLDNKRRWDLLFSTNPSYSTEYIYKVRNKYEDRKNR